MSWAEVKKINSDLTTPLDKILNDSTNGLSAISAKIDSLSGGGVVKSVQYGKQKQYTTVNISTVNPDKCIVLINGLYTYPSNGSASQNYSLPYLNSISEDRITFSSSGNSGNFADFGWQVIEFY